MPELTPFQAEGFTPEDFFLYQGNDYHILKKNNRFLKLVKDTGKSHVCVARVDGKGMDSEGNTSLFLPVTALKKTISYSQALSKTDALTKAIPLGSLGLKFDSDKLEFSLLPKGVLQPIIRVLGFGKKKYAADNWQRVDNARERYYNAIQRHMTSWWEGEKTDPETGENHLAHAACCILFLLWFDNQTGKG